MVVAISYVMHGHLHTLYVYAYQLFSLIVFSSCKIFLKVF
uniref:Uncharacterized protein n=1 Tax=Rhizophora mucronata TaxID=61149 RepID=A0A2P2QWV3_RHIMU